MARAKSSRGVGRAGAGTGVKLPVFVWCERAAALDRHEDRLAFIEREVPEAFQSITKKSLPHFIVARIDAERDRLKRRELIRDAMTAKHDPDWARGFILHMVADA